MQFNRIAFRTDPGSVRYGISFTIPESCFLPQAMLTYKTVCITVWLLKLVVHINSK